MYKILKALVTDNGTESNKCMDALSADLMAQVAAAETEGWQANGGLLIYSRPTRNGTAVWLMQAVAKSPPFNPSDHDDRFLSGKERATEHREKNAKVAAAAKSAI